ncbi:MAG: hypothetical protein NC110_05455 [Ruminococcus sp.]|nr:hypothetical protein [Ruminococcus sp.]
MYAPPDREKYEAMLMDFEKDYADYSAALEKWKAKKRTAQAERDAKAVEKCKSKIKWHEQMLKELEKLIRNTKKLT